MVNGNSGSLNDNSGISEQATWTQDCTFFPLLLANFKCFATAIAEVGKILFRFFCTSTQYQLQVTWLMSRDDSILL